MIDHKDLIDDVFQDILEALQRQPHITTSQIRSLAKHICASIHMKYKNDFWGTKQKLTSKTEKSE